MRKTLLLSLLFVIAATPVFATELLSNPGFETGDLSPWYQARDYCNGNCVNWNVTNTKSHSGTYSAMDEGNIELRQDFAPTPGSPNHERHFLGHRRLWLWRCGLLLYRQLR